MDTLSKAKEGTGMKVDRRLHYRLRNEAARRGMSVWQLTNEVVLIGLRHSEACPPAKPRPNAAAS